MRLPTWLSQLTAPIAPYRPNLLNGAYLGLCLLAPVALFLCFFNPSVLDVTRIGWVLEADWGQHVNGWNAYRYCADGFNHQLCMAAPVGNTLISTDSNPPFAFLFKLLSPLLPANFQYIGLWFFFCVCMHFLFAWKLVRPNVPNRWAAFGGAIALSVLPALYYRMRHDTLMAQWLILWALHLFINVAGDELGDLRQTPWRAVASWFNSGRKMMGWAALMFFTGLLHPYLLFMVAAIWAGDVLKRFWPAARKLDRVVLADTVARAVFVLMVTVGALWLAGTFTKGMSPTAGGWTYYSTGLDSFFNPVRQEFSNIMKAWPLNGGQSFEGYQYLGFGLLVLIAVAAGAFVTTPAKGEARAFLGRLVYLTLPFIGLACVAFTNHGMAYGVTLWNFPLPKFLLGPAAVLRASGRMLWPVAYCLVLTAVVVLFKSRPRIAAFALPAVLALQAYDLSGFAANMRAATALSANPQTYYVTPSPVWDRLVASARGVDFYPANVHYNDKLFYELTWRATSADKPVNTVYAARENLMQVAYEDQGQDAFKEGRVNNDHLFVFLKQCDAPASLWPRLRMLDGVWIIPPAAAGDIADDLPKPQWSPVASKLRFGWLDQGTCLLDENWSKPDVEGVWSDGPKAGIVIPIRYVKFDTPAPRRLDLKVSARSRSPVDVTVVVNGVKVGKISLTRQRSDNTLHLPASALRSESLSIRFLVDGRGEVIPVEPVTPVKVAGRGRSGVSASARAPAATPDPLGIKLVNLTLADRDAPPAPVLKASSGA